MHPKIPVEISFLLGFFICIKFLFKCILTLDTMKLILYGCLEHKYFMQKEIEMLTKNDMARVVVQALYSKETLPEKDHIAVKKYEKMKKCDLREYYTKAYDILIKKA